MEKAMNRRSTAWLAILAIAAMLPAMASGQDAGLVTQLRGRASYSAGGAAPADVTPMMKIRPGDHLILAAGGTFKLLYFRSGTVETWSGPAGMTVGEEHSESSSGQMSAITLPGPARAPLELARISSINRIGGVVVRGITPPDADLKQARERYDAWRAQTTPDDLLPDFYLYAVYKQHKREAEMRALAADMLKRAPDDAQAQALAHPGEAAVK